MATRGRDPYQTLGVSQAASDEEIRAAYRHLVQLHHPDHNHGSAESERRFEEVQDAYAEIRSLRAAPRGAPRGQASTGSAGQTPPPTFDDDVEARAQALERELRKAHAAREAARERARRAARDAVAGTKPRRPTDEELGYVKTDDSFSKILADARAELSDRFSEARESPAGKRVSDLIDELDALTSKLSGKD